MKRHYDHSNSYKGKHLIVVAYSFRGLVHSYLVLHDGVQADMVMENELRVLHLDPQATGSELYHWA